MSEGEREGVRARQESLYKNDRLCQIDIKSVKQKVSEKETERYIFSEGKRE